MEIIVFIVQLLIKYSLKHLSIKSFKRAWRKFYKINFAAKASLKNYLFCMLKSFYGFIVAFAGLMILKEKSYDLEILIQIKKFLEILFPVLLLFSLIEFIRAAIIRSKLEKK